MRVYIFVAIFVTGSNFCFAIKAGAKPCNDSDTNERTPLGTSPHEAYAISGNALRFNVTLVDNEAHINDKANEERGLKKFLAGILKSLSRET
ncbi:hypothetical protein Plhal703r1_c06g0034481 [Plasmopara halstedii]